MIRLLLSAAFLFTTTISIQAQKLKPIVENRFEPVQEITQQQRLLINQRLQQNIDSLKKEGALGKAQDIDLQFSFPLLAADNFFGLGYYGITNFVDHNSDYPNQLTDYTCGVRTFDRENGFNHSGTDFSLFPFPWKKMDEDKVAVIAAAPGTIIEKTDGNPDKNCGISDEEWNAVYIRHDDGSVAWYGSLKTNSLTGKSIGERVEVGEKLGIVGSSGSSTSPHLHFEIQDENGEVIDPFSGECNAVESLWKDQPEYIDSEFNDIIISTEYYGEYYREGLDLKCNEATNLENVDSFLEDDRNLRIFLYMNDRVKNIPAYGRVRDPDGKLIDSFTFLLTDDQEWARDFYKFSIWEFSFAIPEVTRNGIWNLTFTMEDGVYNQDDGKIIHKFSVSSLFDKPIKTENLNPENGAMVEDRDTYLRWVPMADADFYTIQIAEDEGFTQGLEEVISSERSAQVSDLSDNKDYYWRVKSTNQYGESEWSEASSFSTGMATTTSQEVSQQPENFSLSQNYPNPFNPTTQIKYDVGNAGDVKLTVYNALGQQVKTLVDTKKNKGTYTTTFDATDLPSGIYYYEFKTANFSEVKPMTLIK